MRRPVLIFALLAAANPAVPSPCQGADGTWTFLPYLSWGSGVRQILVDDAPRHRHLLIGDGEHGASYPLVWARPKDGSSGWAPLPSVNTPWAGSANVILDPVRDRLVIWDGANLNLLTASLPEPLTWSSRHIPGGPNDYESAVAYDAAHRRMLLFSGGGADQAMTPDVYALTLDDDTAVWSTLPAEGPAPTPREEAVAVVDPVHDRLIVHGGLDFSSSSPHNVRGDVWALSLSDPIRWTPLFTADSISELCYAFHSAVYDPVRQRMLLFGGGTGDYFAPGHAEVRAFALDGSNTWSIAAAPDSMRGVPGEYNSAVYDSASDAALDFDATYYPAEQHATYRLALSPSPSWSLVERNGEPPRWRFGQATAFDPVRNRWLSFGGRYTFYVAHGDYSTTTYNDVWSVSFGDRPEWTTLAPLGAPPPERQDGKMLYDPRDHRMILFGGQFTEGVGELHFGHYGITHFYGDTWSLSLSGSMAWSPLAQVGPTPAPRDGHVMVLDSRRHRVLVFGGRDSHGAMNDLWALSLDGTPAWTQLTPAGTPPAPRWEAVGCYDATADRLVIAGGVDSTGQHPDAFEISLGDGSPAWSPLPTTGSPPTAGDHTRPYVFDTARRRILVFGDGNDPEEVPGSGSFSSWALDLTGAPAWTPLALGGDAPRVSYGNSAAFDSVGDRVLLSGGAYGELGQYTMNRYWLLSFSGLEAPVSLMLSSLTATSHRVSLDWLRTPTASGIVARVERSGPDGAWREIGAPVPTGRDHLTFADPDVAPSIRYGYRLRTNQGGVERVSPETWVTVPGQLQLVLESPSPNPGPAGALVAFDLPQPGHVELSVFDIGGRRRERHAIEAATPGRYSLRVGRDLAPGMYLIQLAAGSQSRTSKLCVVP